MTQLPSARHPALVSLLTVVLRVDTLLTLQTSKLRLGEVESHGPPHSMGLPPLQKGPRSQFSHNRGAEVLLQVASRGFQSQEVRIQIPAPTNLLAVQLWASGSTSLSLCFLTYAKEVDYYS